MKFLIPCKIAIDAEVEVEADTKEMAMARAERMSSADMIILEERVDALDPDEDGRS